MSIGSLRIRFKILHWFIIFISYDLRSICKSLRYQKIECVSFLGLGVRGEWGEGSMREEFMNVAVDCIMALKVCMYV